MPVPAPPPSLPIIRGALVARRLRLPAATERETHVVATGRTGSGKTTLANRLLGIDYFLSDGRQDCTREVNHIRFPGGLAYSDLPGICSDDLLENVNRLALGLPQVEDAPPADALTIATYTPQQPPARLRLAAGDADGPTRAPDLVLYLLAADKQFTSGDRRYLLDLLARHPRVVYVLNVFSNSPPSGPNVRDLASRIAAAHRRACPDVPGPRIVPFDCRTGEGLADLLEAARQVLGGPAGEHLADVLRDVDRAIPSCFARDLAAHLIGQADDARTASGPADARHPLLAASLAAFDLALGYASSDPAGDRSALARLLPIVAEAVGSADEPPQGGADPAEMASDLLALAGHFATDFLPRAQRDRDALQAEVEAFFREERRSSDRRTEGMRERAAALAASGEQIDRDAADLRRRSDELAAQVETHEAESLDLRTRIAVHEAEIDALNDEMESHRDRVDEFRDVLEAVSRAGGLDPSDAHRVQRESARVDREGRGLNRRAESLNSAGRGLQREIPAINERARALEAAREQFNQDVRPFNERVTAHRAERSRAAADGLAAGQEAASARLARETYLHLYYEGYRGQSDRLAALRDRIAYTLRRSRRDEPLQTEVHARLRARFYQESQEIASAARAMRHQWCRFRAERVVERAILSCATDHFDEAETGQHRGSTFRDVGVDGAVALLACATAAIASGDPFRDFEALKAAAGESPGPLGECDGLLEILEGRIGAAIR